MIFYEPPVDFRPWFEVASCCCEHEGRILMLKRLEGKSAGGTWGAAGGKIDAGETIPQAVIREVLEETGIALKEGQAELAQTFFVRHGDKDYVYHLHRATFIQQPPVTLNPLEHTEYTWLPIEQVLDLLLVPNMEGCLRFVYKQ